MTQLLQDLKYAVRTLGKNPGFTFVILAVLALGIGANTAIFSIVYAVMLRPLPYPQAERLVMVWEDYQKRGGPQREWTNPANFADWRAQNTSFSEMFFLNDWNPTLTGDAEPELVSGSLVSQGMFATLGVQPALGRAFSEVEDKPKGERVLVLSDGYWKRRFGGDRQILGRSLLLSGNAYTVIGIMPPGFRFPIIPNADVWAPAQLAADSRGNAFLRVIARLKPGVSIGQASSEMNTIAGRLEQQYPETNKGTGVFLANLQADMAGPARLALLLLLSAVGLVLLIACANVANLLMARASARQKEIAVRRALGASRGRLVRQLLTESLLLSFAGGVLGILLAVWLSGILAAAAPDGLAQAYSFTMDANILLFTALVSLVTGVLFGIAPALQATRREVQGVLQEGSRGSSGAHDRMRRALVVCEVALSLVLLTGAGLLLKSFYLVLQQNPGFNPQHVMALSINLPQTKYAEAPQATAMYREILQAVRALPGVTSAGAVNNLPLSGNNSDTTFFVEGQSESSADYKHRAWYTPITTGYLETMQIPLRRGRGFSERDDAQAGRVILINETMARQFFPGADPIGKRIGFGQRPSAETKWREIVGVVGNVRFFGLEQEEDPAIYFPHAQVAARRMNVVVRSTGDAVALGAALRSTVWGLDRDLAIPQMQTLEEVISLSVASRKFSLFLVGAFAALALLLAAVGLYGLMSFAVTQRTREIGIRMALGAQPGEMRALVLKQGMVLAGIGAGLGLLLALALGRSLETLLFGIRPNDPATFVAVAVALAAVAALACYIPARRATRVDPMVALRYE